MVITTPFRGAPNVRYSVRRSRVEPFGVFSRKPGRAMCLPSALMRDDTALFPQGGKAGAVLRLLTHGLVVEDDTLMKASTRVVKNSR